MNKLIPIILNHYQTMITEYSKGNWFTRLIRTPRPDTIIVSQKPYNSEVECIVFEDHVIRRWEITENEITEVACDFELEIPASIDDPFAKRGFGSFWISDGNAIVHIGYQLDILYGEGWDYEIKDENDKIDLVKKKRIWVS